MKGQEQAALDWWKENAQRFPPFYASNAQFSMAIHPDTLREIVIRAYSAGVRRGESRR
jgi:hypothetical protein